MTLSERDVGGVFSFVMEEAIRFAKMGRDVVKAIEGLDFLCAIYGPERRMWLVGRPAFERLRDLTNRALEASPYHRRITPENAFRQVREGFGLTYFATDFAGTSDAEDLANLNAWISAGANACTTLSHFIPCNIGIPAGRKVSVGPVTIEAGGDGLVSIEPVLDVWSNSPAGREGRDRRHEVTGAMRYLKGFRDIAQVTVPDCDPDTSRAVANEAVQAALAYIHIMAGAAYTRRMRSGGPALDGRRFSLALDHDGQPYLTWSAQWEGAHVDDEFWTWLASDDQGRMTEAVGVAIDTVVNRQDVQMLARRYLDAAAWYADAATEERPPAAIVKYLTAMERLLWTGERFGVTKRLAERAAALCFSIERWDFDDLRHQIEEAYDLRSGILHGRLADDDPAILRSYRVCESVSRELLISWVHRYGEGFEHETTIERAKAYFDGFVAGVAAETARRTENHGGVTHHPGDLSPMSD